MERCDCKMNGACLAMRGELPENQICVEIRSRRQKQDQQRRQIEQHKKRTPLDCDCRTQTISYVS